MDILSLSIPDGVLCLTRAIAGAVEAIQPFEKYTHMMNEPRDTYEVYCLSKVKIAVIPAHHN